MACKSWKACYAWYSPAHTPFIFSIHSVLVTIILLVPRPCLKAPFWIQVGFSHSNILRSIIRRACTRYPNLAPFCSASDHVPRRSKTSLRSEPVCKGKRKVFVIFGGDSSERQVSLISGTNVWLNLQAFDDVSIQFMGTVVFLVYNMLNGLICWSCGLKCLEWRHWLNFHDNT